MERFTKSVRAAVAQQNWYGALALALTLPDICCRLEDPSDRRAQRYIGWWDRYVAGKYVGFHFDEHTVRSILSSGDIDALGQHLLSRQAGRPFLSSADAYALRCAYLHQGGDVIEGERVRELVNRFHVITPPRSGPIHSNMSIIMGSECAEYTLQVQVDVLCADICDGVAQWEIDVKDCGEVQARKGNLMVIHDSSDGMIF